MVIEGCCHYLNIVRWEILRLPIDLVSKFELNVFNLFRRISFSFDFFVLSDAFFNYFGVEHIISQKEQRYVILRIWVFSSHLFVYKISALILMIQYIIQGLFNYILNLWIVIWQFVSHEVFKIGAQIKVGVWTTAHPVSILLWWISNTQSWPQVIRSDEVCKLNDVFHMVFGEDCFAIVFTFVHWEYEMVLASFVPGHKFNTFKINVKRSLSYIKLKLVLNPCGLLKVPFVSDWVNLFEIPFLILKLFII